MTEIIDTEHTAHEQEFDTLLQEYVFALGIEFWLTQDLIKLANLIDTELQTRAAENTLNDSDVWDYGGGSSLPRRD